MNSAKESPVCRKRHRSCDGGTCDLMPISKRIHDLHIRSNMLEPDCPSPCKNVGYMQAQAPPRPCHCDVPQVVISEDQNYNVDMEELRSVTIHPSQVVSSHLHPNYSPELGARENPYYYHINGTLFEAHMQRMLRIRKNELSVP